MCVVNIISCTVYGHLLCVCFPGSFCLIIMSIIIHTLMKSLLRLLSKTKKNIHMNITASSSTTGAAACSLALPALTLSLLLSNTAAEDEDGSPATAPPLSCGASVAATAAAPAAAGSAGIAIPAGGGVPSGGDQAP